MLCLDYPFSSGCIYYIRNVSVVGWKAEKVTLLFGVLLTLSYTLHRCTHETSGMADAIGHMYQVPFWMYETHSKQVSTKPSRNLNVRLLSCIPLSFMILFLVNHHHLLSFELPSSSTTLYIFNLFLFLLFFFYIHRADVFSYFFFFISTSTFLYIYSTCFHFIISFFYQHLAICLVYHSNYSQDRKMNL